MLTAVAIFGFDINLNVERTFPMKEPNAQSSAKSKQEPPTSPTDAEELIRRRADELYEQRGDGPGDAVHDYCRPKGSGQLDRRAEHEGSSLTL
jgi:hypothetical protein